MIVQVVLELKSLMAVGINDLRQRSFLHGGLLNSKHTSPEHYTDCKQYDFMIAVSKIQKSQTASFKWPYIIRFVQLTSIIQSCMSR